MYCRWMPLQSIQAAMPLQRTLVAPAPLGSSMAAAAPPPPPPPPLPPDRRLGPADDEEEDEDDAEAKCLLDLRWCLACCFRSYVEKGRCINVHCVGDLEGGSSSCRMPPPEDPPSLPRIVGLVCRRPPKRQEALCQGKIVWEDLRSAFCSLDAYSCLRTPPQCLEAFLSAF